MASLSDDQWCHFSFFQGSKTLNNTRRWPYFASSPKSREGFVAPPSSPNDVLVMTLSWYWNKKVLRWSGTRSDWYHQRSVPVIEAKFWTKPLTFLGVGHIHLIGRVSLSVNSLLKSSVQHSWHGYRLKTRGDLCTSIPINANRELYFLCRGRLWKLCSLTAHMCRIKCSMLNAFYVLCDCYHFTQRNFQSFLDETRL